MEVIYKCICKSCTHDSVLIEGFNKEKTEEILQRKNYCAFCSTENPEVVIEEVK